MRIEIGGLIDANSITERIEEALDRARAAVGSLKMGSMNLYISLYDEDGVLITNTREGEYGISDIYLNAGGCSRPALTGEGKHRINEHVRHREQKSFQSNNCLGAARPGRTNTVASKKALEEQSLVESEFRKEFRARYDHACLITRTILNSELRDAFIDSLNSCLSANWLGDDGKGYPTPGINDTKLPRFSHQAGLLVVQRPGKKIFTKTENPLGKFNVHEVWPHYHTQHWKESMVGFCKIMSDFMATPEQHYTLLGGLLNPNLLRTEVRSRLREEGKINFLQDPVSRYMPGGLR